jgi:hypothetical protein
LDIVEEVCRDFELGRLDADGDVSQGTAAPPPISTDLVLREQEPIAARADAASARQRAMFKDYTTQPKRRFSFFS